MAKEADAPVVEKPELDKAPQEPAPPMMEPDEKEVQPEVKADEPAKPDEPEKKAFEIDPEDIIEREDGRFEFIVDPDDPKSSRYLGKDLKELFANIRKGEKDKDGFIHKLRSEQLSADSHKGKGSKRGDTASSSAEFPEWGTILGETAKQHGISPEMLSWTDEQWAAHADEKGLRDFAVTKLMGKAEKVREIAKARYDEENVQAINDSTLDSENEQVKMLVADSGVSEDFTPEMYHDILSKVLGEDKNFNKTGLRKEGVVVSAAAKEITRLAVAKKAKEIQKKTDEAIASGRSVKAEVKSSGPSKQEFKKTQAKPPSTYDDAVNELLREIAAGKIKT